MSPVRIPRATYRLQFNADFTFADAERIVPYLGDLGISHIYASCFLKARAGSTHGYDITDHHELNPEIGDEASFERLTAALARHGMGLIMDFVPNHMGVGGADNAWWLDVLEWGEESPYASYFDIDWKPARLALHDKLMLPFLGGHYGDVLEAGELVPQFDRGEGSISVWYYGHRLPIAARHYARLLSDAADLMAGSRGADDLEDIALAAQALASARAGKPAVAARRRLAGEVKTRLAALAAAAPAVGDALDGVLRRLHGALPDLHRLLEAQSFRISYWRVAADEINYRRFFDINDLAGIRIERMDLFEIAHARIFRWLAEGKLDGLRIDHVDGLYNPAEYCHRLQRRAEELSGGPIYLVVEKILAHHESIRRDWPVDGTTGYDFMNQVGGLFVDGAGEAGLDAAYRAFTGDEVDFDRLVYESKTQIMADVMASELQVLAVQLGRIAQSHWRSRDFTISGLRASLTEVVACFPVYRTYVTPRRVSDNDRRYVEWAVAQARKRGDSSIFDFLQGVLTTDLARGAAPPYRRSVVVDFAMRLQQYTGPVMAKGFEDTALYRYNRLLSLNEVGGEPRRFGISPTAFHQANRARQRRFPHAMLATATHDAKRGEDVRVRIAALSEMPDEWRQRLERWARLNQGFKREVDGSPAPEAADEMVLYQTMLGAWPAEDDAAAFGDRLCGAIVKAMREAKRRTQWGVPNEDYEQAMVDFIGRIIETGRRNPFLDDFLPFQARLARLGMINGLAQTLLKLTSPGMPDIYQGCELWQLALVDPDNRRPVDYDRRRRALESVRLADFRTLLDAPQDGLIKLYVIWRILGLRTAWPDLFAHGSYQPLTARGALAGHVCAFARSHGDDTIIVAAPLLLARIWPQHQAGPPLGAAWRGLHIETPRGKGRHYRNLFTGRDHLPIRRRGIEVLPGHDLFADFPVALLQSRADAALKP